MDEPDILIRPKRLILELSRNCNLHCIMCGFGGQPIDPGWFMNRDVLKYLLNQKDDDFFKDIEEIRLNGRGESTLHPNFEDILNNISISYPKARLTLFTNLMVANDRIIKTLNDNNVEVFVSIDSANPVTFEAIRRGAKFDILCNRLKNIKNGFLVFTLQKSNFYEVENIGHFSADNNLGLIINVVRTDDETYKKDFTALLNSNWESLILQLHTLHNRIPKGKLLIPDQIWGISVPEFIATTISCGQLPLCPNIGQEIMIAYDGTIYPCNMFNSEIYGTIFESSLSQIWGSHRHRAFFQTHKENGYCQHCEYMIPKQVI